MNSTQQNTLEIVPNNNKNSFLNFVEFLMVTQAHVSFQFGMKLNHKQCNNTIAAVNQDHKKNNHAQDTKSYPGKTLLNQGKNLTTLYNIAKRRTLSTEKSSAHNRVLYDQER
jgi:hypothetical protein